MESPALASSLKDRRRALKLSQEELAHRARCSLNTVRNYENGLAPKASEALDRIELALTAAERHAA